MFAPKLLFHGDECGSSGGQMEERISPSKIYVRPCVYFNSFKNISALNNRDINLFDDNSKLVSLSKSYSKNNVIDDLDLPTESGVPYFLIGRSVAMRKLLKLLLMLDGTDKVKVLIIGEPGTGKELVARFIKERSYRRNKSNDRTLNCSQISNDINSSRAEFTGSEKGSYTGSDRNRKGLLEICDLATLTLDEIQNLSIECQAILLRFLETGEFSIMGNNESAVKKSDVRIIAISNANLPEMIEKGLFRKDFYSRIAGWIIKVPSLNERREDIPVLAKSFIDMDELKIAAFSHLSYRFEFENNSENILENYHYEFNVRQLKELIKNAMVVSKYSNITKKGVYQITESHLMLAAEMARVELISTDSNKDKFDEAIGVLNQIEDIILNEFINEKKITDTKMSKLFITKTGKKGISRKNFVDDYIVPNRKLFQELLYKFPAKWNESRARFKLIRN